MQKAPPSPQGPHGELTELSVMGAHELVVAAAIVLERDSKSLTATTSALHGAGAIATADAEAFFVDVAV
jgi:hypothetical protein